MLNVYSYTPNRSVTTSARVSLAIDHLREESKTVEFHNTLEDGYYVIELSVGLLMNINAFVIPNVSNSSSIDRKLCRMSLT